jgi:hypothetical protein
VPPTLTDGSFYVTVYGTPPYTCTLFNGNPVITTVDYVFSITNDAPNRVGWRFYQVLNTNSEQVDSLGWELDLSNAPAGAEIAIRRNAVPGAWNYRNDPYDYYGYGSLGATWTFPARSVSSSSPIIRPMSGISASIPRPAPWASFVLTGSQLTGGRLALTARQQRGQRHQPAFEGKWNYFVVTVPANAFGWDLRLTNVTTGIGTPQMYICLDQLPSSSRPVELNSYV